jgi:hypothetical protein
MVATSRHADLIGLGVISLRPRFLQFILELCAFFNQLRLVDLDPLQFGSMVGALPRGNRVKHMFSQFRTII